MKNLFRHSSALFGATLFAIAPLAMAQHGPDIDWSITIGSSAPAPVYNPPPRVVYVDPEPVYVPPRVVHVRPAPVYVPPRVVHVQPAPVVYYQHYNPRPVYYVEKGRHKHHHRKHQHRHDG